MSSRGYALSTTTPKRIGWSQKWGCYHHSGRLDLVSKVMLFPFPSSSFDRMGLPRIMLVGLVLLLNVASSGAQVEEDTLVASSAFRMAISPTISELRQGALELIRETAVAELKEAQSSSGLPYVLNKTKVVLQDAELQVGNDLTIIRFFALATQRTISVPGTSFEDARIRAAEARQEALNGLVETATGSNQFIERLYENGNVAFASGDGSVSAEAVSQILAIDSIAVAPVETPIVDEPDDSSSTSRKNLSTVDIVLIVVIVAIFLVIVLIVLQFRRDRKENASRSGEPADVSPVVNNRPLPISDQLGTTPADEEAGHSSSSEETHGTSNVQTKGATSELSSSSASGTSGSAGTSTGTSEESKESERDAGSAHTPSVSSSVALSKAYSSQSSLGSKSSESEKTASDAIKDSLYSSNFAAMQSLSLSQSDSAAFVDDDVSDVVAELLKTTVADHSANDILAETKPSNGEILHSEDSLNGGADERLSFAESMAETFTSEFFGSSDSTPKGKNLRDQFASNGQSSSSSSYYSSSGSSSSEDLFKVDVESAASKKSSSVDSKHSSPAAVTEWMKTIQVVSESSTDSKTTASSHDRTSISSLTAPSMATSVGVSSLELSLGRLDRRQANAVIDEREEGEV